jgi:rod shape-determining protein MreD
MNKIPIKQIIIYTILAIFLHSISISNFIDTISPFWVLIFYSYFLLNFEFEFEYTIAFIVGLIIDISTGGILGQSSLALVFASLVILKSKKQVQIANDFTIAIFVMFSAIIYLGVILLVHIIIQGIDFNYFILISPLTTAVFYPLTATIMQQFNARKNQYF